MLLTGNEGFDDFELLDSGDGERLERWGAHTLVRPDPQAIWARALPREDWEKAGAKFFDDKWHFDTPLPDSWELNFRDLRLIAKPTSFKHTGVFPEQAANWVWMEERLKGLERPRVLNLFAYTGAATMWLTKRGSFVTHVDASGPALDWARQNQKLNGLADDSVRWILDDAAAFAKKEAKRGNQYEGIVLDPPAFGHAPSGKTWKFNRDLPGLLVSCAQLLSPDARFLLINAYATNSSELSLQNLLEDVLKGREGKIESGQLCLKQANGRLVSVGIFARWTR